MSLEGNLRELELSEVFQLLAHSRKSGVLSITAQLEGRTAAVLFHRGQIVDASCSLIGAETEFAKDVQGTALELLQWKDGVFAFAPDSDISEERAQRSGARISTELLLVEAARRAEGWSRVCDLVPNERVVPAFVNVEPHQLPLLNLVPQQWEVLTRVDGQRDLSALSLVLRRDILEVAEIVHGLIATGLLTMRDSSRSARTHKTPPASRSLDTTRDLWVPEENAVRADSPERSDDDDLIFDPVSVGVTTPEGLPRLRTPLYRPIVPAPVAETPDHRSLGDDAARSGDLAQALMHWSAYLRANEQGDDADHVREAIGLAARLHALLYATHSN